VSSPVAFDRIDFSIDGGSVRWTEHYCPCDFNGDPDGRLDTTKLANGPHTLKVDAYDATGREVATGAETVNVSNGSGSAPAGTTTTTTTTPTTTTTTTPTTPTTTTTTTTTPTTATPAQSGCFTSPGSCGYPDPAYGNVGVPAGTTLTPSGSVTVNTAGTVLNGLDIQGGVTINANNVTIQNSRITCSCGNWIVYLNHVSGFTLKNVTVDGVSAQGYGIWNNASTGTILDHVYDKHVEQLIHDDGGSITVEDS